MPRLTIETSHALGEAEALRRLKDKFDSVQDTFRDKVSDLRGQWDENTFSFGFTAAGMKISGTAKVDDSQVKLDTDLPLAAMMFKGMIKARVDEELGNLLA